MADSSEGERCEEKARVAPKSRVPSPGSAESGLVERVFGPLLLWRASGGWVAAGPWEEPGQHAGRKAAWARRPFPWARSLCALGMWSKQKCVLAAESASAVVPGDSPVSSPAEDCQWEADGGGRGGAGPARAMSVYPPHLGARAGRPPERAAGPSVRASGADWLVGRRGRGKGWSSRWAAASLPRRPWRAVLGPRRPEQQLNEQPELCRQPV